MLRRNVVALSGTLILALIIAVPPAIVGLRLLETKTFPVVTTAVITSQNRLEDRILIIRGTSKRLRNCDFDSLKWYLGAREGRAVRIKIEFKEKDKIRGDGVFEFGPWHIWINPEFGIDETYADAYHQCRIFGFDIPWLTKSQFWPLRVN